MDEKDDSKDKPRDAPVGEKADAKTAAKQPMLPAPSLPKGGGALASIGEKLVAHPQTGTAGFSVPIAVSPGRSGFGPSLSLEYDSGSGQGPWGLGWSVGIPSISRRTEKGLPRYADAEESDVFVFAGAEDLVPVGRNGSVVTYRPRVEGSYARIERHEVGAGSYWVVFSRDNIRSVFGFSPEARIADPATGHVFRWLLEWSDDDRGNVIVYTYKGEDTVGVTLGASELSRSHNNRYIKGIGYAQPAMRADRTALPSKNLGDYPLVVLFDYGDQATEPRFGDAISWPARLDSFSNYRPGFETRTHRLCQRVLMMHRFGTAEHDVVRSTEMTYAPSAAATTLVGVTVVGWKRSGASYTTKSMPTIAFDYTSAALHTHLSRADPAVGVVDGKGARWVDLDAEGLPGILREIPGGAWWYQRPDGETWARPTLMRQRPSVSLSDGWQLQDLDGDGQVDLVKIGEGAWNRRDAVWRQYRRFDSNANIDFSDPNLRFVDLDGDGMPDILVHSGGIFRWHPSLGVRGHGAEQRVPLPEPIPLFSTEREVVALADMTGDGLSDIVHIKPGAVTYWPNLGYGRFGARIAMENAPALDSQARFEPRRVVLADLDGTGTADLVYFGADGVVIARNQAGNSFGAKEVTHLLPPPHAEVIPSVMDVRGRGVAGLVQTSTARADTFKGQAIRVVDLFDEKPYLLTSVDNGRGLKTSIVYAPSTKFYLADRLADKPWMTHLPFPVRVVDTVTVDDAVAETRLTTSYRYHHGHYDGVEREFRGFAMVEQEDTQTLAAFAGKGEYPRGLDETLHIPPTLTKTWFHTGVFLDGMAVSRQLASEYFRAVGGTYALPDSPMPNSWLPEERREAGRALRGKPLRAEIYALDGNPVPYVVTETNYTLVAERRRGNSRYAVFSVFPRETLSVHLERTLGDPRIQHELALSYWGYGDIKEKVAIGYPRAAVPARRAEQERLWALHTRTVTVDHDADRDHYRVGIPTEAISSELVVLPTGQILSFDEVVTAASVLEQGWVSPELRIAPGRWLTQRSQTRYWADDLVTEAPANTPGFQALVSRTLTLALTNDLLQTVWAGRDADIETLAADGGYLIDGDLYWAYAGTLHYDPLQFFLPKSFINPFGGAASIHYESPYLLLPDSAKDPVGNESTFGNDYRLLAPRSVTDPNLTTSEAETDELGIVVSTSVKSSVGDGGTLAEIDYAFGTPSMVHVRSFQTFGAGGQVEQMWIYSDGSGREIQKKQLVVAGPEDPDDPNSPTLSPRYVATGRTVFNNKALPVKKYEPYFSSTASFDTEATLATRGVTPILQYDPIARLIRTDLPNGTYSKVDLDAWSQMTWDEIDTLDTTTSWYVDRIGGSYLREPALEQQAAISALKLAGTPSVAHFDALGRAVATIKDAGNTDPQQFHETSQELDIEGAVLTVRDPRFVKVRGVTERLRVVEQTFDIVGRRLLADSVDAGLTWSLSDALGQSLYTWRAKAGAAGAFRLRHEYDKARRLVGLWELAEGATAEILRERVLYRDGSGVPDYGAGRVFAELDGAGIQTYRYDFRGHVDTTTRNVFIDGSARADWTLQEAWDGQVPLPPSLDLQPLVVRQTWDAAGRQVTRSASVGPRASGTVSTGYDIAGRLASVHAELPAPAGPTPFVTSVDYDAKGRRHQIEWGHGAHTTYHYDHFTFRLASLVTENASTLFQSLVYAYDPVGNITAIRDDAQDTVYIGGRGTPPRRDYTYDALYRLRSATGREHLSQATYDQRDIPDPLAWPLAHGADQNKVISYLEQYLYDPSGNLTELRHKGALNWTRTQTIEDQSNRLNKSTVDGFDSRYKHDDRGNMTSMAHLALMTWNHRDQLISANRTHRGNSADPEAAPKDTAGVHFAYDGRGQRARKTTATSDRIYLGGFELYRDAKVERETLHVLDGQHRIALVETRTGGTAGPDQTIRYQHDDHLGSAIAELDDKANPLSYEEFHPYGTTALFAGLASKRYRYSGMERDDETGLQSHGVRQYSPWLGRWMSTDPAGPVDGTNRYAYCRNSPIRLEDARGTDAHPPPEQIAFSDDDVKSHPSAHVVEHQETEHEKYTRVYARNLAKYEEAANAPRGIDLIGKGVFMISGAILGFALAFAGGAGWAAASLRVGGGIAGGIATPYAADAVLPKQMDPNVREFVVGLSGMAGGVAGEMAGGLGGNLIAPTPRVPLASESSPTLFRNKFPTDAIDTPRVASIPRLRSGQKVGRFNYVVTREGRLIIGHKFNEPGGGHIDLAGGDPVQAAGEVKIVKGEIKYIDNSSGHYLPDGPSAQTATENAFQQAGFDTQGKYVNKVWDGAKWTPKQ